MNITLSDEEAHTLHEFLRERLRDLELETARTEAKAFRHVLVERLRVLERLLEQLEPTHA